MKLSHAAVLAAAFALAACGRDNAAQGGITREQFIRANVALRTVSDTSPQVDSLRARALRKEKVSPAQLTRWVGAHERDTDLMARTWAEISRRVEGRDSAHVRPGPQVIPGMPVTPAAPPSSAPPPMPVPTPPPPMPVPTPPPPPPPVQPAPKPDSAKPAPPPDSGGASAKPAP